MDDNFITRERLGAIKEKESYRKDVIKTLGGPSSISTNGNDEIYSYRNCITKSIGKVVGFFSKKNTIEKDCQQTSIIFQKSKDLVQKVTFLPFADIQIKQDQK
ncbi:MAG: hypothetical protein ABW092_12080 [Candidatus Thiodiazotropha sp.]